MSLSKLVQQFCFQKVWKKYVLGTKLLYYVLKGQLISKGLLLSSKSSKKRTNEFGFLPNSTMIELFRSFFGGIRGWQKVLSKLTDL